MDVRNGIKASIGKGRIILSLSVRTLTLIENVP